MPGLICPNLEEVREDFTRPNSELLIEDNIPPTATEHLCTWAETIVTEGWAAHSTKTASSWSED